MHFDRQTLIRRPARWMACGAILISAGCAGSPLGFKNKGLATVDLKPESGVQAAAAESEDELGQPASAVVTLNTLNSGEEGVQPTAGTAPKKPALPNYARIFGDTGSPQQTAMADPFLGVQSAPQAPTQQVSSAPGSQVVQQPASPAGTARLSDDFDAAMAQLSGGTSTATSEQANPFAAAQQNPFAQPKPPSANPLADAAKPTAEELTAELANALRKPAAEAPATGGQPANPFAKFVGNANVSTTKPARVELGNLVAKKAGEVQQNAEQAATDWVKEAAAALPAPAASTPLNDAAQERLTESPTAGANVVQSAARERIRQLLDSSELALRAGRYDDAQAIAEQAFDIETTEAITFDARDRTPTSILRRVASAKRLAGLPVETEVAASVEPAPKATTITPAAVDPAEGFGSFPTITTWEPVEDGDSTDFVRPRTTLANPAHDPFVEAAGAWQSAGTAPESESDSDVSAVGFSEPTPTTEQRVSSNPFATLEVTEQNAPQDEAYSLAPPIESAQTGLTAPSWPAEPPNQAIEPTPQAPAWPPTDNAFATASLPNLPTLDGNPSDSELGSPGDAFSWANGGENVSVASAEIAPPPPMIVDGAASSPESINFGTILALLTVIGLGLVAVLAFRTRPEGA